VAGVGGQVHVAPLMHCDLNRVLSWPTFVRRFIVHPSDPPPPTRAPRHVWCFVGLSAPLLGASRGLRPAIDGETFGLPISASQV